MKNSFYILSILILFTAYSCKKDSSSSEIPKKIVGVESEEYYDEDANTFEIPETAEDTSDETLPIYNAESGPKVTKITTVAGLKVGSAQGLDDCNTYKYASNYYIVDNTDKVITVQLNRADQVRSIINASNFFADQVIIDNLIQSDSSLIRFTIRASKDTLQTKTVDVAMISGIPLGQLGYPTIKFKLKCVGQLADHNGQKHLYGTNKWMEMYWCKYFKKTVSTPNPVVITADYVPQIGDVLLWTNGHTGTIFTTPSNITRNRPRSQGGAAYLQSRFYLSEMNSRCRGEKTIKYMWYKSYDKANTLRGANKTRGNPNFYYRY